MGPEIRFWEDLWWGDRSLRLQFPRLFKIITIKTRLI